MERVRFSIFLSPSEEDEEEEEQGEQKKIARRKVQQQHTGCFYCYYMAPMLHFSSKPSEGQSKINSRKCFFLNQKNGSIEKTDHDRMTFFFTLHGFFFLVGYDRRIGFRISAQQKKQKNKRKNVGNFDVYKVYSQPVRSSSNGHKICRRYIPLRLLT